MVAAAPILLWALLLAGPESPTLSEQTKPAAAAELENRPPATNAEAEAPPAVSAEKPTIKQQPLPAANKLPPAVRAKLMMLLVLIVFLGFLAVMAVLIGGRWLRFYTRHSEAPSTRLPPQNVDEDDWAKKPIVPHDPLSEDP